jgi:hypothetical protein
LLQWFGDTPSPWQINSEIGDLSGEVLGGQSLLRFQRYDMPLETGWLRDNLDHHVSQKQLKNLRRFDNPSTMQELYGLAARVAAKQIRAEHLLPTGTKQES